MKKIILAALISAGTLSMSAQNFGIRTAILRRPRQILTIKDQ